MARKSPSFGQLLAYMTIPEQAGPTVTHNMRALANDLPAVHREFLDNARYLPPRKNGNVLYHEIISFSDLDLPSITPSILEDLTRKYLELRAPRALAFAQAHLDTACPHMHIMIAANELVSRKRLRLSRADFAGVKRSLEKYQRKRYPFLQHSVVFGGSQQKGQQKGLQSRAESERERRLEKELRAVPSQKDQIRDLILEQLTAAPSGKALFLRLKRLSLHLYKHGKTVGVQDVSTGKRYRLKTLGLEDAFDTALRQWKQQPGRLVALEAQELKHEQQLWQKEGFREQIRDVLALHVSELSPSERERLEQVRSARIVQRQDDRESPVQSL